MHPMFEEQDRLDRARRSAYLAKEDRGQRMFWLALTTFVVVGLIVLAIMPAVPALIVSLGLIVLAVCIK
jgi:hypothetical protein